MQKRHTKGFFINSSYRKTRTLKSLLHGLARRQEDEEDVGVVYDYPKKSNLTKSTKDAGDDDPPGLKKAISI